DFSNADIPRLVKDFDKKIEFISGENNGFKLKKENANENDTAKQPSDSIAFIQNFLNKLKFYLRK
ncbi:MAG: hypothetical protein LBV66_03120, partial [Elusimicrobiota bacterium]|nr:hypothetical protein [Elusimicrobiota bacterium]